MAGLKKPVWVAAATGGFQWTPPPYPDYKHGQGAYLHPYFHRAVAADLLSRWWYRNQRMRWLFRKWLRRVREHRISQRQHGAAVDLGTCEPIPEGHRVTVFDVPTRSVYHFHTATIHRALLKDILYQRYAVPAPATPKNPYTNLPWSVGQLCVIMDQLQTNLWRSRHRFVDCVLVKFRQAAYDVGELYRIFGKHLTFRCAVAFFKDPTCDDWEDMYDETFMDLMLFAQTDLRNNDIRLLRIYLVHRSLPKDMLESWDNLVIAFWINENYGEWPDLATNDGIYSEVNRMAKSTLEWIKVDRVKLRAAGTPKSALY
jgi:hypothetical protein